MTDLPSVLRNAVHIRGLGITRRLSRDRIRRLAAEADRARDIKDWPTASRLYQQVLDIDGSNFRIQVQLGHAYKEQGDFANAERCYQAARQLAPDDDDVHLQIGHLEKLKGSFSDAARAYRTAAELNPENADAVAEYAALAARLDLPPLAFGASKDPIGAPARIGTKSTAALPPVSAAASGSGTGRGNAMTTVALSRRAQAQELRARGDRARDNRNWDLAAQCYKAYLELEPGDSAIWVQLGHSLKESGDHAAGEAAYRTALGIAPEDADIQLQLGHILKLRGKTEDALKAYSRSFELQPLRSTWTELLALDRTGDPLALRPIRSVRRGPGLMLDISDLLIVLSTTEAISGIQRVQLGLLSSILASPSDDSCQFVVWRQRALWVLSKPALKALVPVAAATAPPLKDRIRLIAEVEGTSVLYFPVPGDTIVSTGVIYFEPDLVAQRERLKRAGIRLGAYFHDFIPLTHPEYCAQILINDFCKTASEALVHLDFVLATSEHVATETRRLLQQSGYPAIPVRAVPLAHSFGPEQPANDQWTPAIEALRGREYVLCVGTVSTHKNQSFLVQTWQLLVQEGYDPPLLVLAGGQNFGSDEVRMRLAWSNNVGGRVRLIEKPTDDELAVLYRNCLFTMFPSLVEGWGLPVGESLINGKLCIASQEASIPEVGGDLAIYIDPYNVRACADLLRGLLQDRAKLAELDARVKFRFKPRSWKQHSGEFLAAAREMSAATADAGDRRLGVLAPGRTIRTRNQRARDWEFGKTLPEYRGFVENLQARMALVEGWHASESWGTWMSGRRARLCFHTQVPPGSVVTVILQFRAVPWSMQNALTISAECGASISVNLPAGAAAQWAWREQRYKETVAAIDCMVGRDGSVGLTLEITGPLTPPWWDETRPICLGLVRFSHISAEAADVRHPPNRRLRPTAFAGPSGEIAYPIGLRSMLAALRGNAMLVFGWEAPETWGVWMSGASAGLKLKTEYPAGERIRVALQMSVRAGSGSGCDIAIEACDGSARWRLPVAGASEPVWLDCSVGQDGCVVLEISDRTVGFRAAGRRIGLVSIAYGRRGTAEDRMALAEAMLYPAPEDPDSGYAALLPDIGFTVAGHFNGTYSLAAINRSLALGLDAVHPGGVRIEQIETEPVYDISGVPAAERGPISDLARRSLDAAGVDVAIVQHWPVLEPPPCDLPIALFAWEESLVPRDIVERLNRDYRAVIVQSRAVQKALLDSGTAIPIHWVGCAIDLSEYSKVGVDRAATPRPAVDDDHPFVFLHVSSCFPRKGVDVLLAAYSEAFRLGDPVRLVIKTFPNPHNDAAEKIKRLRSENANTPPIHLIDEDMGGEELLRLYAEADAMVLPTRGEGFNMPAAEAMAAGLPLIVTEYGGHADFVDPQVARTIDYRFAASRSHVGAPGSVWVEPDKAELAAALREMLADSRNGRGSTERTARARQAIAPFGNRALWGRRVAETACRLAVAAPLRRVSVGWVSTWNIRCGIAEYSRHLLRHFDRAAEDVRVFCDQRTRRDSSVSADGPAVQIAWRQAHGPSMDNLAAAIAQAAVDVVIVQHHNGYMFWDHLSALLCDERVNSRPIVVLLHHPRDLVSIDSGRRGAVLSALRLATRVLVHSVEDLNLLKSCGLVDNVALFPHGAEAGEMAPRRVRGFGLGGSPLLGAYGFFFAHKGFDRLIGALPALRSRWPAIRLRLVTAEHEDGASGLEVARCKELARSLGVADAIEWVTKYLPNHRSLELLNECDLIALPYRDTTESASGAARVALASRAPVAVTPIRIFDEFGRAVLRFDSDNADDIAAGIAAMLNDEAGRQTAIDEAAQWLANHDWKVLASRLHGMATGIVATDRTGG